MSRRQVRVTKEHNEECKRLLGLMGIPCVTVSPSIRGLRKLTEGSGRSRGPVCRARSCW